MRSKLQRWSEQRGRVDISIAVDLPVAQKFGAFEARDHAKHAGLFGEAHVVLKAHQVVTLGTKIFLTKLHHGVRPAACSWIHQAHRFHWTEAQRFAPAA